MKKKIAVLLIMSLLGSSSVWALSEGLLYGGVSMVGGGVITCLIPSMFASDSSDSDSSDSDSSALIIYLLGGIIAVGGLGMIIGAFFVDDPGYAKAIEDNPILKHVSLATNGKQTHIGFHWSF